MIAAKEHFHGSDLEKIEQIYKIRKEEIIQFGANVNPLGLSEHFKSELSKNLDVICSYPDREYLALRQDIAAYCHTDYSFCIVGNGSTELIAQSIQSLRPKKAMVIAPSYSEYENELKKAGSEITYFPLSEEDDFRLKTQKLFHALGKDCDLLICCNPNNPTSGFIPISDMKEILEYGRNENITVIVDETYAEFTEDIRQVSAIPLVKEYENLIVLRGISKFYAAPGLRLGYAITSNKKTREEIVKALNPWSVNSVAATAAGILFRDEDFIRKTKKLIADERRFCVEELNQIKGLKVFSPSANFVLVKITDENRHSDELFDFCIRKKLMIRDCATFPYLNEQFFRFCFMKHEENILLLQAIKEFMED